MRANYKEKLYGKTISANYMGKLYGQTIWARENYEGKLLG
jgi:hypothetical protein